MVKCFHEAPLSIFKKVQAKTDGDYALVHLFQTDKEYLEQFEQAVAAGREVILDNSLFELRKKFDPYEFTKWVCYLKPAYYIVPDVWKDCGGTIEAFHEFYYRYVPTIRREAPDSKIIGVAQGYGLEDTARCYKEIELLCDKVAFNFDYSIFWTAFKFDPPAQAMSYGRMAVIRALDDLGVINREKPHHLLGCGVPQEMKFYNQMGMEFIDSVDTCNPVINGMRRVRYSPQGLQSKLPDKMCDCMHETVDTDQWLMIEHNIDMFRSFAND